MSDPALLIDDLRYALKGLSQHTLGTGFGEDAGHCWCDPFYRGSEWPGHDERCAWIRTLIPQAQHDKAAREVMDEDE